MRQYLVAVVGYFLLATTSTTVSQEPTHWVQLMVDSKPIEFKGQILEVFEKEGLKKRNSELLSFLYQDLEPAFVRQILQIRNHSLTIATHWHLLQSSAFISASTNLKNTKHLADLKSHFIGVLETELNCQLPPAVYRYFNDSTFESGYWRRKKFEGTGSFLKDRREFPFSFSDELAPDIGSPYVTAKSAAGDLVIYVVKDSARIVAQKHTRNQRLWNTELEHSWNDEKGYTVLNLSCVMPQINIVFLSLHRRILH